jgi:hypothetical protein
MNFKSTLRLSYLAIFVILLLQSCEEKSSLGEDLQVEMLPTVISYPDILNVREFSYVESAVPFMNSNGHPVTFELMSVKKGDEILDASYLSSVSILNYSVIDSIKIRNQAVTDSISPDSVWYVQTNDLAEMGKIIIEDGNSFANGEYFFTLKGTAEINGAMESKVYEDALRLVVGPELAVGIAYCPFKMNFVSAESTTSDPSQLFGGNPDIRYELGSESDKLTIDASSGAISLNTSYTISETEYLYPIINAVSNISEEVVSFEGTFTAVLSATPIELEKEADYFFFPTLKLTSNQNVNLGGNGYSHQVVENHTADNWFNTKALWRNKAPEPDTPDAIAARETAGVTGTQALEHSLWTLVEPSESWIVMDPVNLALYEGCFDSKAVFWYSIFLNEFAGYELDGSTPIDLEVHITNNYTGDVATTDWTQVNDILECEINNNGIIFTGTPYPGDQSGIQPPNGVKDPTNSPNNLWVRGELNLDEYRSESSFTIAFRLKTYFDTAPNLPVNGIVKLSNVHFVATEK